MPPHYNSFFDLLPISNKQASRIESIVTWREHFFFGTDSRVHVYQILGFDTKKPESKPRAVIPVSTNSGKTAPVRQIALLPEKNCMLVLCGDTLSVHNLPAYDAICRDAVPASLFDVSRDVLRDPGEVGGFHIKRDNGKYVLACYTLTKKVLVYEYYENGKAFKKIGEYPIPERPRSIMWVGPRILLAFKGSYTLLTPTGGSSASSGSTASGAVGGGAASASSLPEMIMDTGRSGESCVVNLDPHQEYLIGIDTIGGRVPISGKAPSAGCKWQSVPLSIAYRDPYVLAVQNDSLEVYYPWRASHSHSLVHALTRKGVNKISQRSFIRFDDPPQPRESINDQRRDAIVLVDSSNSIFLFHMLTVDQQVGELIAQNEFEAALELCERCSVEVSEKTVRTVHFRYAMSRLFSSPDVDTLADRLKKALEHFNTCEADPLHVISLFPNFLPRELLDVARSSSSSGQQAGGSVSSASFSPGVGSASSSSPSAATGAGAEKTLPLDRNATVRDRCLELLMTYLESHRSRILSNRATMMANAIMVATNNAAASSGGGGGGEGIVAPTALSGSNLAKAEAEKRTLTAIDTALLKTYIYLKKEERLASVLLNPASSNSVGGVAATVGASAASSSAAASSGAAGSTSAHFCAIDNCSSFLAERGEWVALALFRRSKGLHDAALRDLRLLGARGALPETTANNSTSDGKTANTSGANASSLSVAVPSTTVTPAPANLPKLSEDIVEIVTKRFSHVELANTRKFMSKQAIENKIKEDLADMSDRARTFNLNQVIGIVTTIAYLRTSLDVTVPLLAEIHSEYCRWLLTDLPAYIGVLLFVGLDVPGVSPQKALNFFDPSLVISNILEKISGGLTSKTALIAAYLEAILGPDCEGTVREALHDLRAKVLIELAAERRRLAEGEEDGTPIPLSDDGLGPLGAAAFSSGSSAGVAVGGSSSNTNMMMPSSPCEEIIAGLLQRDSANNHSFGHNQHGHSHHHNQSSQQKVEVTPEQRLFIFLQRSKHFNPTTVLFLLERSPIAAVFTKQRALVYSRKGEHHKAITMFLQEAHDIATAKRYATYASREGSGDAFKILLEELTKPRESDSAEMKRSKMEQALQVVNTCVGVDASTAVPMLPDETPLGQLSSFLVASLRASHTNRRNLEVSAAISTTRLREVQLAAQLQKKRFVELDDSSVCCKCGFKIRKDTMFAVFPNGNLAHQLCYEHESVDPATRQDFRQGIHTIYL